MTNPIGSYAAMRELRALADVIPRGRHHGCRRTEVRALGRTAPGVLARWLKQWNRKEYNAAQH